MRAAMFRAHPYGTPIIGWRHDVERLTGADAMAFYRDHYAPGNATLVVAGDVRAEDAIAMARAHYGAISARPGAGPTPRPQEPPHLAARQVTLTDARVGTPYVTRMYMAPTRHDAQQAAALQVLAALLGGSRTTSVLAQALQFDSDIALSSWASYRGVARDHGQFTVGVAPVDGVSLDQAEAALDTALENFLRDGVDPERFARVRRQIRASEIYERDSIQGRARNYGAGLSVGLTIDQVAGWPERLDAVTPEQVMEAARLLRDDARSVTGYLRRPATEEGS